MNLWKNLQKKFKNFECRNKKISNGINGKRKMNHRCNLCGYEWRSLLEKPKACPKCKRYDYFEEVKKEEVKEDENRA